MGMENKLLETYLKPDIVRVTFVTGTTTYYMKANDLRVEVDGSAGVAGTVYLPPVAEAMGRIYAIVSAPGKFSATITVADRDDAYDQVSDDELAADKDRLLFYSDGASWYLLCDYGT